MAADIEDVVRRASAWMDIDGVELVGQGEREGRPVVTVAVSNDRAAAQIPPTFDGYPVLIEHTDPITAHRIR